MTLLCLPARSNVQAPILKAPPLACDCHFHVFGEQAAYPFGLPRDYTPPPATVEAYLAMAGTLGLERMVIVQPSVYGTDNRCTLDAMAAFGHDKCRAVLVLGDDLEPAELKRMTDAGVRGIRFNMVNAGGPAWDRVVDLARLVAPFGWHLQFYLNGDQLPVLGPVLAALPTPVVIDHMGQIKANSPTYRDEIEALRRLLATGRTWVKLCGYRASTSAYPYDDVAPLARTIIETAAERCVWGTDWPHPGLQDGMPDDSRLLDLLGTWTPSQPVRDRILVDNAAELYGF